MFLAHLAMQGAAYSLFCYNMLPIWSLAGNTIGQLYGVKKLYEFKKKPDVKNSKAVKNSVYLPFLFVLLGIYVNGYLRKRRERKEAAE